MVQVNTHENTKPRSVWEYKYDTKHFTTQLTHYDVVHIVSEQKYYGEKWITCDT